MKCLLLICCALFLGGLSSDAQVLQRLEQARRLNDAGHYMEAYDSLRILHRDVGKMRDSLDFLSYMNILTSEAQCAYKVNLSTEMESVCSELSRAVEERLADYPAGEDEYRWQIASLHKSKGDLLYMKGTVHAPAYEKARTEYERAAEFFGLANDTRAKAKVYAELAQLEYIQGNYREALAYMEQACSAGNRRRSTGSNAIVEFKRADDIDTDISFQSALAMCRARTHSFRKALSIIEETMSALPEGDPHMPELKRRKAKILLMQHEETGSDIQDAGLLYEAYFNDIKEYVYGNFMQMTADQREKYWMLQRPFVVDCYMLENLNPELLYDVTLYNKGMLLQTARSFDDLLYDGTGGSIDERGLLFELRQQDARNAIGGVPGTLAGDYERKLLRTMKTDGRRDRFFSTLNHSWMDVREAMPDDGCAIEFVEYSKHGHMHFGAIVLNKGGKPEFVHICDADELASYHPAGSSFPLKTLLESTDGRLKNDIYEDPAIRGFIWNHKLVEAIGNSGRIYFSADGYLHQLAIEYMLPESMQGRKLFRLSSTRVLIDGDRADSARISKGAAFVLGGIQYDSYSGEPEKPENGNDVKAFRAMQARGATFAYMKGAKAECDSIVHSRNNPDDLYLSGLDATEHAFYENCGKYPILHLSTHGYFFGDRTVYNELLASTSGDVLSESVLALSYANNGLHDSESDGFGYDGLLSAREIARLRLDDVELVTTSACQTGLGYITADGIYGMQRGFKSAGVKAMVTTLWSVNVESARIFFTSFYKYMAQGESVYEAFSHARNDLLTTEYAGTFTRSEFNRRTLSNKERTVTETHKYDKPQHSCPYLLTDVWE